MSIEFVGASLLAICAGHAPFPHAKHRLQASSYKGGGSVRVSIDFVGASLLAICAGLSPIAACQQSPAGQLLQGRVQ